MQMCQNRNLWFWQRVYGSMLYCSCNSFVSSLLYFRSFMILPLTFVFNPPGTEFYIIFFPHGYLIVPTSFIENLTFSLLLCIYYTQIWVCLCLAFLFGFIYTKVKTSRSSKDSMKIAKKKKKWNERRFIYKICNKGPVLRIHRKLLQIKKKKQSNPIENWASNLNRHFTKRKPTWPINIQNSVQLYQL